MAVLDASPVWQRSPRLQCREQTPEVPEWVLLGGSSWARVGAVGGHMSEGWGGTEDGV